ncbi:universal stress protein [Rhizobium lentis]|uniref:Nucleotide-binding universal stress UspA family protein n=1 Tax=Rhizobium lentis TaxID=1138194 RepID=A0A7W8XDP6_9HYPH|nr:universal stress protein [Rhizobium lentis]MBB4574586.1 nucleotide-binding universal stress UspA family protein [Rhizobium lentis]MBB5550513.1 nucleotide-binding universal stress UspA family protein [Rhizobium lentis]MBB5561365.1 nucleotide-binding universal stress UspA family protein [Rhizobium lentis]MBB5567632.1 nucleotide-binding universal stress UspA family protein [Rhizobium lentis]
MNSWKPHDHAQRAVVAARRWLAAANRVTVLCVNDKPDGSYQFTARKVLKQLGLDGDVIAIAGSRSVGETILDFAKVANATCLLIGAFKHGYFLNLLLGRVTRYLLSHSTLPMMMKALAVGCRHLTTWHEPLDRLLAIVDTLIHS